MPPAVRVLLARNGQTSCHRPRTMHQLPIRFDQMESCVVSTTSDWRIRFLEYFIEGILPGNHEEAYHLKKLATRYFMEGGILFLTGFNGEPLRCLGDLEAA